MLYFPSNFNQYDPGRAFLLFLALGWIFSSFPLISWFFYLFAFSGILFKIYFFFIAVKQHFKSKKSQK